MISVWILPFAFAGLMTSWYIFFKKEKKQELVCAIGTDCNKVIYSKWSKVLGIRLEILGVLYYGTIIMFLALSILGIEYIGRIFLPAVLLIITGGGASFSLGLIYIQGFIIREWCEYCLISAFMSWIIAAIELFSWL